MTFAGPCGKSLPQRGEGGGRVRPHVMHLSTRGRDVQPSYQFYPAISATQPWRITGKEVEL